MRYISYNEITPNHNFPSLKNHLEAASYKGKNEILKYLNSGKIELARVSRSRDVFSGKIIPTEVLVMTDGEYCWSNELAYYVEKYNLRLPKDFENHILNR